jgi:hypothetical protein
MKETIANAIKIAIVLVDVANNTNAYVVPRSVRECLCEALEELQNM